MSAAVAAVRNAVPATAEREARIPRVLIVILVPSE
jgi:hypothetical protein